MKKIMNHAAFLFLAVLLSNFGFAQDVTQRQTMDKSLMTDPTKSQQFLNDLNRRDPNTVNQNIEWTDNEYGHYGTYSLDNVNYMTRYDQKGNFQGTYRKKDWSDASVPASLKSSFDKSTYKGSDVSSYWESADPTNKTYYFELSNDKGKNSKVWADDKGKFSTKPYTQKSTPPKAY